MMNSSAKVLITHVTIEEDKKELFADWQARLNEILTKAKGFISLEIFPPNDSFSNKYQIILNFDSSEDLLAWEKTDTWCSFKKELQSFQAHQTPAEFYEEKKASPKATEIFLAQVLPGKEEEYQKWIAKIHGIEARFPGFLGIFVQLPVSGRSPNWITFIQFDSEASLGKWLNSNERRDVLKEASRLTKSLESHRVVSSYAGWFTSLVREGISPPVWKQTMLVLLFLFPIVIFELKWLSPATANLNLSLATFIGNVISVTLLAWPFMPLGIWLLRWWLVPKEGNVWNEIFGTALIVILYLIEIALFWKIF